MERFKQSADYEALIARLKLAIEVSVKKIKCRNDSKLITEQVNEVFQARETQMQNIIVWSRNYWNTLTTMNSL